MGRWRWQVRQEDCPAESPALQGRQERGRVPESLRGDDLVVQGEVALLHHARAGALPATTQAAPMASIRTRPTQ